jgi:O-antigen ligase
MSTASSYPQSPAPGFEWWRPERPPAPATGEASRRSPSSRVAFGGLLVFLFILLLAPQSFVPALGKLRIALLTAAVALGSLIFDNFVRGRSLTVVTREIAAAGLLALWATATVPLSLWPGGSLQFLLDTYFKTLAIFWLIANVVDTQQRLERVLWWLSLLGIPLAATAVKNFLGGAYNAALLAQGIKRIEGYSAALTENPNDMALMLNLLIPMGVALLAFNRGLLRRAVLVGMIVLAAAGVVVTFSRAGFLTLAAMTVLYLLRMVGQGKALRVVGVLVLAAWAVTLLPPGYTNRLATISNIDTDPTHSAQDRWADTEAAFGYFVSHPVVGAGVGQNMLALNEARGSAWREVHNVYLEYGVELGVIGLGLFLSLYAFCLQKARWVRRRASVGRRRSLAAMAEAMEVALVAFGIAAFFHPVAYHFYFYLIAGLAVACWRIAEADGVLARRGWLYQAQAVARR